MDLKEADETKAVTSFKKFLSFINSLILSIKMFIVHLKEGKKI